MSVYLGTSEPAEDRRRRWAAAVDGAYGVAAYLPASYVEDLRQLDARRQEQLDRR